MDDRKIKYIEQAVWFKTMEHYPKTIGQMKLLISITDKIGIFDKFDLVMTSEMESKKLNILYVVLRITNKAFNKYLNYAIKKLFRKEFKQILAQHFPNTYYFNLFSDQFIQDLDHFVCSVIKTNYPGMDQTTIKEKLCEYLKSTFQKTFYENIMNKISYHIGNEFYVEHDDFLEKLIANFIKYTNDTLGETYEMMFMFLEKIFSPNCSYQTINKIINSLEKYIDIKHLFKENCMEIDIYSEQKLDDEFGTNDFIYTNIPIIEPIVERKINKISTKIKNKINHSHIVQV